VIETMRPGTAVEFGDQVPGRGEHDRVEPSCSVGNPSVKRILSCGGEVADMNAPVIKVGVECVWFAFAEGECCCCFGGVGEAVQLGQAEGAVAVLDVAEDTAGAYRGQLLIITTRRTAQAFSWPKRSRRPRPGMTPRDVDRRTTSREPNQRVSDDPRRAISPVMGLPSGVETR
jgi:hypothetical protein